MSSESNAPSAIARRESVWLFCGASAVAMMLGWGLRGFIGGGPLGAMIPGAMISVVTIAEMIAGTEAIGLGADSR